MDRQVLKIIKKNKLDMILFNYVDLINENFKEIELLKNNILGKKDNIESFENPVSTGEFKKFLKNYSYKIEGDTLLDILNSIVENLDFKDPILIEDRIDSGEIIINFIEKNILTYSYEEDRYVSDVFLYSLTYNLNNEIISNIDLVKNAYGCQCQLEKAEFKAHYSIESNKNHFIICMKLKEIYNKSLIYKNDFKKIYENMISIIY